MDVITYYVSEKGLLPYIQTANYGISEKHNGNTRIWHFNLLEIAWHQSQTNIVALIKLSCVVLWT